mmetsp:Transcript_4520/g.9376  ORF Transcript_4520/g.9376 Transcript_4520/m.9376 type:complete len:216 (-) Transcript_4520:4-651(-)|eukprot:CAMPEP_0113414608 /NCGR_PEP_ID=MMETSP0013_2-20120614/24110_1 /TAXON_ID=2843 ORGANISM="Skeletonema costatum, Strain 1716" /NCGR_SAMPLE_ID=MMETSP0013_2 /ASSEMBLY_ACC=CAM_ASM_000158 /LENGTH=215 /DNA_ID=CAMNT_0000301481 /DNA_START=87 /DNA_END=734 /DNA_ORIENTATION=+ /assembly_acc=CAM_ASM_000158
MMRLTTFLVVVALLFGTTAAYTVLPQRSSHFVGHGVYHTSTTTASTTSSSATLEMKKGKPNVSPNMRSQYARAQEMESYRQSMMDSQRMGADGFPVFNLYVRTNLKNMWYPCGSFKGDEKSAALCQNYADNGLLSSISKNQLDSGVGGSLYRDLARLEETIVRGYPQLRKEKGNLEFGYKLSFGGLSKEQEKIQVVEVKEQKGFFDGLKNVFGGN